MTRRELLAAAAALALPPGLARAQSPYPGVAYRDYWRCLPDFMTGLAARAYALRNREIAKLTNPEAIRARQRWVRATFWRLTGGMPERTPLNARPMASFERKGYRVEKLVYESRPNFHIPANLYIPTASNPPFPGVLFQMGHTRNGKAADTYQTCCQALAQLGYLVLAFDPMGQGERVYYPADDSNLTRLGNPGAEHTLPGKQMLLFGDTSTRLQVWDAVRSLDYLAAHPLADPQRLASTGQSGGGTLTMLLAAVDDRLAAAVVCMGNTENVACANFVPPGAADDAEQNLVDSAPAGFDRWDVLYPLAPKPLLITVSDIDAYGTYSARYIPNGWEEFQKLRRVYTALGHRDHLAWGNTPLHHGLAYDSRMQVYNFFARWLKGETRPVQEEPPVAPEPDATLWVAQSGNVLRTFHGETPFTLNRSRQAQTAPMALDRLLRADRARPGVSVTTLRRVSSSRGVSIESIEVPSAANVWIPAWLFLPPKASQPGPLLIVLEPTGRNVRWREGELYQELALAGCAVCQPDLRGIGNLDPQVSPGYPSYAAKHQQEENYAWASLMLGKPLLGQRVTDILALAAALRGNALLRSRKMRLAALGRLTTAAMFAAALDPAIEELYLAGGLVSYRNIVDTEEFSTPFAEFVPEILLHTDLPQVAASLAPRRICLAGTVSAAGKVMPAAAVQEVYRDASNVTIRPRANWDIESLLG